MNITEKAEALAGLDLCDHCFGRQFARLGHGLENYERSRIIYALLDSGEDIEEEDIDPEKVPEGDIDRSEDCSICKGLFQDLEHYTEIAFNALERYDFNTYLAGTRPPSDVVAAEEDLWEEYGLQWVEPIKSELNRLIGKRIEAKLEEERDMDTTVDFERADVNFIVDMDKDRVEIQVNSLLVHGFYNKLERGLPQTEWPCGNCRGKGCDDCDWTGKQYQDSVQELIAEPFIEAVNGLETKFHGCVSANATVSSYSSILAKDIEEGSKVKGFCPRQKSESSVSVTDTLTFCGDIDAYTIKSSTGMEITVSSAHPFLTPQGFRNASKLKEGEKVLVKEELNDYPRDEDRRLIGKEEIENTANEYFESVNLDKICRELKDRDLLPLSTHNENLEVIVRLIGVLFGDGSAVIARNRDTALFFYGLPEQLEEIVKDIEKLGFDVSMERVKESSSKVEDVSGDFREISGKADEVIVYSKSLWTLLVTLGVPVGNKITQVVEVPDWIKEGPRFVQREFLASLFGCEMETPRIDNRRYNRKSMSSLKFSVNKIEEHLEEAKSYAKSLVDMLRGFGVDASSVRSKEYTKRKDGHTSHKIAFDVKNNYRNMITFLEKVGFESNRRKEEKGLMLLAYLKKKRTAIDRRVNALEEAKKLDEKGIKLSKIHDLISDTVSKKNLWNWLNRDKDPSKGMKTKNDFPNFPDWADKNWVGKGYYWSEIVEVENSSAERFTSISVEAPHTFTANGFVTHNSGREDVDARCLGKREFVLEVLEPQRRDLDLEELQKKVNEENEGRVQVFNLDFCDKDLIEKTKSRRSHKTYRALVELEEDVSEEDLEKLEELKGTVNQKTPTRVDHRRASKTRKRDVLDISWEKKGEKELEIEIKGEAGLYIKELISGDEAKTKPSVAHTLDTEAECLELDVIDIEKPEGYEDV